MKFSHFYAILLLFVEFCLADIYLHNPRGSNNRLYESQRAVRNNKRLFNSQNNNRGGYNVGSLFYYAGSKLPIEWTNQHSCGTTNSHCEVVIQYMCGEHVRDGATTDTIPLNASHCADKNCDTDIRYGMNEEHGYYTRCARRERNKGLFIADQNLNRNRETAIHTRQNAAGTRYGYECTEERDYYPYWHPTPWKDIVVMTTNVRRCPYYRSESENVKSRWRCVVIAGATGVIVPNNKVDCESFCYPPDDPNCVRGRWAEHPSHGLPPPDCREAQFSRDNHLGNTAGGQANVYNWTIPDIEQEKCVIRIRYNVSTNDYDPWTTDSSSNGKNGVNIAKKHGFADKETAEARGYVFKGNPAVKIFDDADFDLQLTINTNQYGRTFQDRTHTFAIRKRPEHLEKAVIHNLNVRGKRGNIVQVYPSVEYDFVPNTLETSLGEYVHIQWTGSNTNNNGNAGNGLAGTDRSNLVMLRAPAYPEASGAQYGPGAVYGHYGTNYPAILTNKTFIGMGVSQVENLAFLSPGQFRGSMSELDDAGTYFNLEPHKISGVGTYHFMSTRNNDFSNRDQKGRIVVYEHARLYHTFGWMGGTVEFNENFTVRAEQGAFSMEQTVRLEYWSRGQGQKVIENLGRDIPVGANFASDFLLIYPAERFPEGSAFTVEMRVDSDVPDLYVYRSHPDSFISWTKLNINHTDDLVTFQTERGGAFVARHGSTGLATGAIVGIVIGVVVFVLIVVGTIVYCWRHPKKLKSVQTKLRYTQRSMKNVI